MSNEDIIDNVKIEEMETDSDDFDEIEEITEYEDADEDEEYEDDDEEEDDEDDDDDDDDDEEEDDEDEDEEDEEEDVEEDDYEQDDSKFEQILGELRNLNVNLSGGRNNSSLPMMFTTQQNVPYTDPYLNSEMSRMRDEVLKTSVHQSMQQNNQLLTEMARMREEMARSSSQNMQYELIKLRDEMSKDNNSGGRSGGFEMYSELSKMRDEMSKNSLNGVNAEMTRLREELNNRGLKDSVNKEVEELKRQIRELETAKKAELVAIPVKTGYVNPELEEVKSQMNKLREQLSEAITERKRPTEGRFSIAKENDGYHFNNGSGYDKEQALNIVGEIKKLREDVSQNAARDSQILARKIDTVARQSAEEEKRNRQILNAIGKMFSLSNKQLKGLSDKNQDMITSFKSAIDENIKELGGVKGEISKIKATPLSEIEDVAKRSNKEISDEIGVQLGALAKDIISKVDDKSRQEELYKELGAIKNAIVRSNGMVNEKISTMANQLISGNNVTAEQLKELRGNVKNIAMKELSELATVKKSLERLDGTDTMIKEIDKKIAAAGEAMMKSVDMMSNEMKKELTDMQKNSNAEKIMETIRGAINNVTVETIEHSLKQIRGELKRDLGVVMEDSNGKVEDMLEAQEQRTMKALNNLSFDGLDRTIADVMKAIQENNVANKENFKDVAARLDVHTESTLGIRRDISTIAKEIAKSTDMSKQLLSGIAKRMIAEFDQNKAVSQKAMADVKNDIKSVYAKSVEQIVAVKNELMSIDTTANISAYMNDKMASLAVSLDNSFDVVGKQIAIVLNDNSKVEAINSVLGTISAEIKAEFKHSLEMGEAISTQVVSFKTAFEQNGEGVKNILSGLAKRMIKEFDDNKITMPKLLGQIKSDLDSSYKRTLEELNEYKDAVLTLNNSDEMMSLISAKMDSVADGIDTQIDKIKEEVLFVVNNGEKIEVISEALDTMANDIKGQLMTSIDKSISAIDGISHKFAGLSSEIAQDANTRISSVLSGITDKISKVSEELSNLEIASIKRELSSKMDDQEEKLLGSFNQQLRDIKTSLIDVIGQNDMIENIAKNVRDVKSDITKEMEKAIRPYDNTELVQELIKQVNLLTEYTLENTKQGFEDKQDVLYKFDELKVRLENVNTNGELDEIKAELISLKEIVEESKVPDGVLVSLIEQINEIDKGLAGENSKVQGSLDQLNSAFSQLYYVVEELKNKEYEIKPNDDVRVKANKILIQKLNEIKTALVDAVINGANKKQAMQLATSLDRLSEKVESNLPKDDSINFFK